MPRSEYGDYLKPRKTTLDILPFIPTEWQNRDEVVNGILKLQPDERRSSVSNRVRSLIDNGYIEERKKTNEIKRVWL